MARLLFWEGVPEKLMRALSLAVFFKAYKALYFKVLGVDLKYSPHIC